jgi:hypothetical protein
MSDPKPAHHPHGDPNGGSNHPGKRPYWRRAHRTVTFWIAVVLMLAAMIIYVMSDNLGGWRRGQPQQPAITP